MRQRYASATVAGFIVGLRVYQRLALPAAWGDSHVWGGRMVFTVGKHVQVIDNAGGDSSQDTITVVGGRVQVNL